MGDPNPVAKRIHQWVAHICLTTTVSISSSLSDDDDEKSKIPADFFFNASALGLVVNGVKELVYDTAAASQHFTAY